ncbi:hypothetical protein M2463_002140 [Parabacteroides sp. PH5-13]|uniref:TonB-dependent receptor n=1 Tax=unclassified Parabacteroides TaxID=2649774 RepID=UPI0024755DA2|nr:MULTISPECIES: TonB-dependent receptor [unclassified Parabacteroides]MDH6305343.1 hypothetical protein [Parabacteroides sp. PH5-39]MDH6320124.1 hypothetical protein [Parabacteroides sp. PH5-13]MDH6323933.1 hypothetical protein [Parabacteroides sp. PH5-8]MDH6385045.1 hypothetical protein [Parabacteroides sp. PH5-17]MDH6394321.1 hypothetical protein [Parabacteroides sp. PFB2-22]
MRRTLLLLTFSFLTLSFFVKAQVTTAGISGKVTEVSSEPMIGVNIMATHTPTGTVYFTVTQPNGTYSFNNLRIGGPYVVDFTYVGFNPEARTGIVLALGEELKLNVSMREDTQSLDEVVIVADRNAIISGNRTGAQEIITRDKMDKLPTLNRSLNDFTKLTPMSSGSNFGGVSYRFNNVTVDGASFNNSFGLSSGLGASGTEPISLEALEQIQVMIAPYDVRNGGFTGAGINSVTKSGSNEYHASVYMYTKSPSMRGYRVKDEILSVKEFSNHQYGLSLSGPIIKNKLFYFINAEMDRVEEPVTYTTENSAPTAEALSDLSQFLSDQLGYNPGGFDVSKTKTQADRITARIDWNINPKNVLSVKYYYLKSYNTNRPSTSGAPKNGRGPNEYAIPFSSSFYRTNNNFNIWMADLNTTINDRMSNYLKVGYSRLRDFRDMDGGFFPQVDILDGNGQAYTTFGTEANSYNNQLDTDIFQIQDNLVVNLGKHQLTFGTQSDYRQFKNGFAQNYPGSWLFASIDDFKFNVLASKDYLAKNGSMQGFNLGQYDPAQFAGYNLNPVAGGLTNAVASGSANTSYRQKYAIGDKFPFSEVNVFQIGLYVQDKWTVSDKLNLTLGLRMDMPIFTTDLPTNDKVAAETYRDGMKIDVSKYPNAKPLFSPRLGFNYNPLEDESLQLRGGTGLFSGTPPYVWISNQAGNNGVLFGDLNLKDDKLPSLGFTGDINTYRPSDGTAPRADISITDPDFKYPNLWKSNLAADYKFLDGWVATVELLYSKDLNAIYHDNIGLETTDKFINDGGSGNARPFYTGEYYSSLEGNQKAANNVIMLRNTNKGYSFYTTLQLQKTFRGTLKGLYLNGSYSFGKSKSVTDGTSSVAYSAWRYRPALNPNAQELGYSAGSFNGRLLLSASYTADWCKTMATNIGLIYQRYRPFRYSYVYNGDANGDRLSGNDLMYIPRNFDEVKDHLVAGKFDSQEDAWKAMDAFIEQDDYLRKNRGKYAERNGAVTPYANQLDLSLYHDIKIFQKNGRPHTLRFSFDIANFLNLLNKDWGVHQTTYLGSQSSPQFQFLTVVSKEKPSADNNYTLKYEMQKDLSDTYKTNIGDISCWQMQFGIKYIF